MGLEGVLRRRVGRVGLGVGGLEGVGAISEAVADLGEGGLGVGLRGVGLGIGGALVVRTEVGMGVEEGGLAISLTDLGGRLTMRLLDHEEGVEVGMAATVVGAAVEGMKAVGMVVDDAMIRALRGVTWSPSDLGRGRRTVIVMGGGMVGMMIGTGIRGSGSMRAISMIRGVSGGIDGAAGISKRVYWAEQAIIMRKSRVSSKRRTDEDGVPARLDSGADCLAYSERYSREQLPRQTSRFEGKDHASTCPPS